MPYKPPIIFIKAFVFEFPYPQNYINATRNEDFKLLIAMIDVM